MPPRTPKEYHVTIREVEAALLARPDLEPRDKLVAVEMLRHVNWQIYKETGALETWIGVEALAERTALGRRTVERARSALRRIGALVPVRRPGPNRAGRVHIKPPAAALPREEPTTGTRAIRTIGIDGGGGGLEEPTAATGGGHTTAIKDGPRADPGMSTAARTVPLPPPREAGKPLEEKTKHARGRASTHAAALRAAGFQPSESERTVVGPVAACGTRQPATDDASMAGTELAIVDALAACGTRLSPAEVNAWLKGCRFFRDHRSVVVVAPGPLHQDWIGNRLSDRMREALDARDIEVRVERSVAPRSSTPRPEGQSVPGRHRNPISRWGMDPAITPAGRYGRLA